MADEHFYFGVYDTEAVAQARAEVLKQRGYSVSGPKKFADGAVNYSDGSGVKKGSTLNFGEAFVVTGEIKSP